MLPSLPPSLHVLLACAALLMTSAAPAVEDSVKDSGLGCSAWCNERTMHWYSKCGGAMLETEPDCRACALCPDLRSPKTLKRNHEPPPHGAMIEGGTMIEEVGLLKRPRQPCVLEYWPGWIEVIHYFAPFLLQMEVVMFWLFPSAPQHSGLWFPPGRVLVCEDALDLAIYINFTDYMTLYADVLVQNALSEGGSYPPIFPDLRHLYQHPGFLKTALLEAATRQLRDQVDTIVFSHHMDGLRDTKFGSGYWHKGKVMLNTEYAVLRTSHYFKLQGCPVSSVLRRERRYHPNQTWAAKPGEPALNETLELDLLPCPCDPSFSVLC